MIKNSFMGIDPNKTAVVVLNNNGLRLAYEIKKCLPCSIFLPKKLFVDDSLFYFNNIKDIIPTLFDKYRYIVAIMATGIVVRTIRNFIVSKYSDPAVVVVDEAAHYVVSILSGHEGKANRLACAIASIISAEPVITTASESMKRYIVGLGFRKNVKKEHLEEALASVCNTAKINLSDIKFLATIKRKLFCRAFQELIIEKDLLFRLIDEELISQPFYKFDIYSKPSKYLNIPSVSIPAAVLSAKKPRFILKRAIFSGVVTTVVEDMY
ncbi:MAG: cobalamin biosynthesis protein [Deferribacterota bacterium]|nr:cobalamin biosynthesis protein [Deferribacterota bacterium]